MVQVLEIQQKLKDLPIGIATLDDFSYTRGAHIEPAVVLRNPWVSLYCLSEQTREAIFVQTPDEVDITTGPFLYQAQYDQALRLLAVPYETLHTLAGTISTETVPLVLLHSVGRTGSTLVSKALQEIETVTSLSEPDLYTQIVQMRGASGGRDAELRDLLRSGTTMLFKPSFTRSSTLGIVKFRSFCIEIADLLAAAFPGAKNLFLYRDLPAWLVSNVRAFGGLLEGSEERMRGAAAYLAPYSPLLAAQLRQGAELSAVQFMTLMWLAVVQRYVALHHGGLAMHAARYEDIVADPAAALTSMFAYLGLPDDCVVPALRAFERDSQEGSFLSREAVGTRARVDLTAEHWDQVRQMLDRYPFSGDDRAALPQVISSATIP